MKVKEFNLEFLDLLPDTAHILENVIYVSMKHRTINLRCPCGCGGLTSISLHPTRWAVYFDGRKLTICGGDGGPGSIWNPQLSCGSHYFIRQNKVVFSDVLSLSLRGFYEAKEHVAMLDYEQPERFRPLAKLGDWLRQLMDGCKPR